MRYHANMKNESKCSAYVKNKLEHPESAVVNASLRTTTNPVKSKLFVEQMIENRLDSEYKGYLGKNECKGRPSGSRVVSKIVDGEEFFYVEYFSN